MSDAARPTLLIVEDNEDLLAILRQLLGRKYRVLVAGRGEEGIELARVHRPQLVILDLQLPGLDGVGTGRTIKRELGTAVPILVLTALAGREDAITVMESGCCDAYMTKPAPLAAIETKVAELLEGRTKAA